MAAIHTILRLHCSKVPADSIDCTRLLQVDTHLSCGTDYITSEVLGLEVDARTPDGRDRTARTFRSLSIGSIIPQDTEGVGTT